MNYYHGTIIDIGIAITVRLSYILLRSEISFQRQEVLVSVINYKYLRFSCSESRFLHFEAESDVITIATYVTTGCWGNR